MKYVKESLQDFGLLDTEQVTAIRMVPKGILQVNIRRLSSCSLRNSLMCPLSVSKHMCKPLWTYTNTQTLLLTQTRLIKIRFTCRACFRSTHGGPNALLSRLLEVGIKTPYTVIIIDIDIHSHAFPFHRTQTHRHTHTIKPTHHSPLPLQTRIYAFTLAHVITQHLYYKGTRNSWRQVFCCFS